jgi:hypothetical protein
VRREEPSIRERRTPTRPLRASAIDRHQLSHFDTATWIKKRTTMLLPGASIGDDLQGINQGDAFWLGNNRWEINGRIYVHKGDGTVYPESGDQVISATKPELVVLKLLIELEGNSEQVRERTRLDPLIDNEVRARAMELYAMWKADKAPGP